MSVIQVGLTTEVDVTSEASEALSWCSSIGAYLPIITITTIIFSEIGLSGHQPCQTEKESQWNKFFHGLRDNEVV